MISDGNAQENTCMEYKLKTQLLLHCSYSWNIDNIYIFYVLDHDENKYIVISPANII